MLLFIRTGHFPLFSRVFQPADDQGASGETGIQGPGRSSSEPSGRGHQTLTCYGNTARCFQKPARAAFAVNLTRRTVCC